VDPFDETRIREFWHDAPLLDLELLKNADWEPLRQVPVLLQQMKKLATSRICWNDLTNREAVYYRYSATCCFSTDTRRQAGSRICMKIAHDVI
jgi:hypothetical protein